MRQMLQQEVFSSTGLSVTRLGDFKKISETNVCSKAAQMFSDCLAISKNITFKVKLL